MRGAGQALVLEGPGIDLSDFYENLLQLDESTQKEFPATFYKENVTCIESGSRTVVRNSLQVLDEWAQMRAGRMVVEMPDGSTAIAVCFVH